MNLIFESEHESQGNQRATNTTSAPVLAFRTVTYCTENEETPRSLAEKMARRGVDVAGVFSKTVLNSNGLERRVSRTQDGSQRQEQGKRRVWQGNEAVMPVESRCRLVLGVHHQGEGGNLRTGGTVERIGQQSTT